MSNIFRTFALKISVELSLREARFIKHYVSNTALKTILEQSLKYTFVVIAVPSLVPTRAEAAAARETGDRRLVGVELRAEGLSPRRPDGQCSLAQQRRYVARRGGTAVGRHRVVGSPAESRERRPLVTRSAQEGRREEEEKKKKGK